MIDGFEILSYALGIHSRTMVRAYEEDASHGKGWFYAPVVQQILLKRTFQDARTYPASNQLFDSSSRSNVLQSSLSPLKEFPNIITLIDDGDNFTIPETSIIFNLEDASLVDKEGRWNYVDTEIWASPMDRNQSVPTIFAVNNPIRKQLAIQLQQLTASVTDKDTSLSLIQMRNEDGNDVNVDEARKVIDTDLKEAPIPLNASQSLLSLLTEEQNRVSRLLPLPNALPPLSKPSSAALSFILRMIFHTSSFENITIPVSATRY